MSKRTKKDKYLSRDFGKDELTILGQVVSDDRFKFTKEDLEKVLDENTPKSSDAFWKAEVALKKVTALRKSATKAYYRQQRLNEKAAKSPITKEMALKTFMKIKEGQELAASLEVLLDICIKNKLVTKKGFEKLWQERVLDGRHPDPCPGCKAYEPNAKKGVLPCIITREDHKPTLAKASFPDLTGAKVKRVIACDSYEYNANPNPDLPEENEDEKSNNNEESPKDDGGAS